MIERITSRCWFTNNGGICGRFFSYTTHKNVYTEKLQIIWDSATGKVCRYSEEHTQGVDSWDGVTETYEVQEGEFGEGSHNDKMYFCKIDDEKSACSLHIIKNITTGDMLFTIRKKDITDWEYSGEIIEPFTSEEDLLMLTLIHGSVPIFDFDDVTFGELDLWDEKLPSTLNIVVSSFADGILNLLCNCITEFKDIKGIKSKFIDRENVYGELVQDDYEEDAETKE